ncbi:sensor histidine kinase [Deinococcus ruber]|nr:ATP-binding protein [Deinococcus ruber]
MPRHLVSPERFALAAYDALSANIAILDAQSIIVAVNRAWDDFAQEFAGAGPTANNGLGSNYLAISEATTGDDRPYALATAAGIRDLLAGRRKVAEIEYPCKVANEQRYYMARVTAFDQDGERFVVVAHEDITRRKRAELALESLNRELEARIEARTRELEEAGRAAERHNAELEESNRNLSQFASVAAHDLQEPLRLIGAYADLLRHRSYDRLDTRSQTHLGHLLDQVGRARQLVRDVLTLSRVAVRPTLQPVDMRALWDACIATFPWPDDTRLECADLPPVLGDAAQLRQLFLNLLGNALKFRSARPLELSLRVEVEGPQLHFQLTDNGIGIAPQHHEKVFVMFQRLHSRTPSGLGSSEAPTGGNGVGLAVCKMVVERHGGRLWLTSVEGQGTTFHFTLPAAPSAHGESAVQHRSAPVSE